MILLLATFLACSKGDDSATAPVIAAANSRDWLPRAQEMIANATDTLHIVEYEIYQDDGTVSAILDSLVAAKDRGVDVKILVDEEPGGSASAVSWLRGQGVDAKLDTTSITTHDKLLVSDGAVLAGSTNWSSSSIDWNNEGDLYVEDETVFGWYTDYFDALWTDPAQYPDIPWTGSGPVHPYANPNVQPVLVDCIDNATSEIAVILYAMMYYAGEDNSVPTQVVEALVRAHQRGVTVKVLLDDSSWIRENEINVAASTYLVSQGIEVRFTSTREITHAKVLTCDGRVVVSDANWSTSGLTLYQGVTNVVDDEAIMVAYRSWFTELWGQSAP